jgi:hypothetical protein
MPEKGTVQLYAPLLLPLGLELGGFIFLAAGLTPRRREDAMSRVNLGEKSGDQDENWVPLSGVMIVAVAETRKRFLAL